MTDLELLEAAAKAAGLYADGYRAQLRDGEGWICIRPADEKFAFQSVWAPLTDDGDALRLACQLGLTVECGAATGDVAAYKPGRVRVAAVEWAGLDKESRPAATRRAIVRAAAAMGDQ